MKAFPTTKPLDSWGDPNAGMDLRDYFAAKAMQGMATWDIKTMDKLAKDFGEEPLDYLARNAYAIADAMMKAREQNDAIR
jgi:hypothetical protein